MWRAYGGLIIFQFDEMNVLLKTVRQIREVRFFSRICEVIGVELEAWQGVELKLFAQLERVGI